MSERIEQCQWHGSRTVQFMGRSTKEITRCQERGSDFWHDEIGDGYCGRHARIIQRRAASDRRRTP